MKGLEISTVNLNQALASAETQRLDPEYFQKAHLADESRVAIAPHQYRSFADTGLRVDASAFYPSIEGYYDQGTLPFLRVADVDSVIDFEQCTHIPAELCDQFPTLSRVRSGDIVFTKGGSVARIGLVMKDAAVSRDLIFINSSVLAEKDRLFLYLYFQTTFFNRVLLRSSSQTAQPHLTITLVRNLPVFVCSTALKEKCVALLNESHERRSFSIQKLQDTQHSLLRALGLESWPPLGPLTYTCRASEVLRTVRLDAEHFKPKFAELARRLQKGGDAVLLGSVLSFCERGSQPAYSEAGLPVVNSRHVRTDSVLLDAGNRFAGVEVETLCIKHGDVLMNGTGVGTIGRVAPYLHESSALPDNHVTILRLRADAGFDPVFLAVQLAGIVGQTQVEQHTRGSSGQLELYPNDIRRFLVWRAPMSTQLKVRHGVEAAYAARREAQALLGKAQQAVEIAIEDSEKAALDFLQGGGRG